jgi:hypothetical protein
VAVTYGPVGRTVTSQRHVTTTLGSALYYSITAQLQGSGSVTCEILIGSTLISKSVATGGRSVASCGISRNPSSGKCRTRAAADVPAGSPGPPFRHGPWRNACPAVTNQS